MTDKLFPGSFIRPLAPIRIFVLRSTEWHRTPGPAGADEKYRYAFNGKEQDTQSEWGDLTHYDYGFRIYNPAIAKFLSVDPLSAEYPMLTPYQFASNRPIDGIDLDGLEYQDAEGVWRGDGGVYTHVVNDTWIYSRVESGKSVYYKNSNGFWEKIRSNSPKFGEFRYMQTGTGFGLSSNVSTNGLTGYAGEVANSALAPIFAIGAGVAFAGMAAMNSTLFRGLGAGAEVFVRTLPKAASLEGGFALKVTTKGGLARFGADFSAQYFMNTINQNDGRFLDNYNIASGAANAFLPGAAYANGLGAYFNFSASTIRQAFDGNYSGLTNSTSSGLIGFASGGVLGTVSGTFFNSSLVQKGLVSSRKFNGTFNKVDIWRSTYSDVNNATLGISLDFGSNMYTGAVLGATGNNDKVNQKKD